MEWCPHCSVLCCAIKRYGNFAIHSLVLLLNWLSKVHKYVSHLLIIICVPTVLALFVSGVFELLIHQAFKAWLSAIAVQG